MDSLPAPYFVSANPRHAPVSSPLSPFVLFLDIDGVLYNKSGEMETQKLIHAKMLELFPNATFPYERNILGQASAFFFNEIAVKNLTNLINTIKKTRDVQIVMSSNWREKRSVEELQQLFSMYEFSKYIVSKTPDKLSVEETVCCRMCKTDQETHTIFPGCRAAEIQFWLNQHPQITNYAIIDDCSFDGHLEGVFKGKFYETNFSWLLTEEICKKIFTDTHLIPRSPPINRPQPPTQALVRCLDRSPSNSSGSSLLLKNFLKFVPANNAKTTLKRLYSFMSENKDLIHEEVADFRKPLGSSPVSSIGVSEETEPFGSLMLTPML